MLYWFPVAAGTKSPYTDRLRQHIFVIWPFWSSEAERGPAGLCSDENSFSCLSQLLELLSFLDFRGPFPSGRAATGRASPTFCSEDPGIRPCPPANPGQPSASGRLTSSHTVLTVPCSLTQHVTVSGLGLARLWGPYPADHGGAAALRKKTEVLHRDTYPKAL